MDLTQLLRDRYRLSERSIGLLAEAGERIAFDRKALVVGEGDRDPYVWFIEQGAVRVYVRREEKCVIVAFAFEGDAASQSLGGSDENRSRCNIETLEPTTLIRIPRTRMEELFATEAELADWGRRIAEHRLELHEEYFAEYAWKEKGEQYRLMLREYPQLLQRVPLKDLASYLYVTPQTLSRIRAELVRN